MNLFLEHVKYLLIINKLKTTLFEIATQIITIKD